MVITLNWLNNDYDEYDGHAYKFMGSRPVDI